MILMYAHIVAMTYTSKPTVKKAAHRVGPAVSWDA